MLIRTLIHKPRHLFSRLLSDTNIVPADQILKELVAGNERFVAGESILDGKSSLMRLKRFAKQGQSPKAIILCCSDSRAPVEMIFDQDLGSLFVIRVAGNVVAPSLVGSVEFAATSFNCKLCVVMGHSKCGAIAATLENIHKASFLQSENIHDIVSRIKPHIYHVAEKGGDNVDELVESSVRANVLASVGQLKTSSRIIENLVKNRNLRIAGAVFDLQDGKVKFLEDS